MCCPPPYALALLQQCLLQVLREKPAMCNIMRDIPRQDTQPIAHARLLICMFIPFFELDNLKNVEET